MKTKRVISTIVLASMIVSASPVYAFGDFFKGLFDQLQETTQGYFKEKKDAAIKQEVEGVVKEADQEASSWFLKGDSGDRLMFCGGLVLLAVAGLTYWAKRQQKQGKEFSILGTLLGFGKFAKKTEHGKEKQKETAREVKSAVKSAKSKKDDDAAKEDKSSIGRFVRWAFGLVTSDEKSDAKSEQEKNDEAIAQELAKQEAAAAAARGRA